MKKYVLILFIVLSVVFIAGCEKKDDQKYGNVVSIEYSFSGGFGSMAGTAQKNIKFKSDGSVLLTNGYDSSTASFKIDQSEFDSLAKYIYERVDVFDNKVEEDLNVTDGSNSKITVEFSDKTIKTMGGYMVKNKKYVEIKNKIKELLEKSDTYKEYMKKLN